MSWLGLIVEGRLAAGERLVETRIAREMGISRAPLREAIRRLQQEGLVSSHSRRGPVVTELSGQDIANLYAVRTALEVVAIRAVIARAPDATADALERIIAAMRAAALRDDLSAVARLDLRFHEVLCERSGNAYLARVFQSVSAQVRLALQIDNPGYGSLQLVAQAHVPLVAVIRRRDTEAAVRLIQAHVLITSSEQLSAVP